MSDLIGRARSWIEADPDSATRAELEAVIERGDIVDLEARMNTVLAFGTAGIRGVVGAGPGRMNRAVVIRTTFGLADYLGEVDRPVVVGFDARPSSRQFAEDTCGVLVAAGIPVFYFPKVTPTPLVAYAAKHLAASAAVVVTASHNPPVDNGYKVYGPEASQIVSPVDTQIQHNIEDAPPADRIERLEGVFAGASDLARPVPDDIVDCYWEELSATRVRADGSNLKIVYTPIHGVGKDTVFEVMQRAGHTGIVAVPEQAEPDGTFPTVAFPNPEEPGALDLAIKLAEVNNADVVIANDPDADRLAAVVPHGGGWRLLTGNEMGALLGEYLLAGDKDPTSAIVASSTVSSPLLSRIADRFGARHESTLTGFKWIARAGFTLEGRGLGRFIFGYEEALGYTIGTTVRDKDGISAALIFVDLAADLDDSGETIINQLHRIWRSYGLWVSAQSSVVRPGTTGVGALKAAVERLADNPPRHVGKHRVHDVTDYRKNAESRPPWLGEQALVELDLGETGRILVRPSGTEPKLKVYVDLTEPLGNDPDRQHDELMLHAKTLGDEIAGELGL
ncbi:MAG TPA: phospho-sugar mutase [Acidimicrobiia bacterium]|nr:phospho-sugar mutase [Acidimicrobiia bacterium]